MNVPMIYRAGVLMFVLAAAVATPLHGQALPKPEVGPEKPFAPPPRVERTLSNGLQVIAVRYATVPKASAMLTVRAGLALDPADKAGLAQFVADTAQEGTASRSSEQLKRDIFAMGASLSGRRRAGFDDLPDARAGGVAAADADAARRRRAKPRLSASRDRLAQDQYRAAAPGAVGVAAVCLEQGVPPDAIRRPSLLAHRRDAGEPAEHRPRRHHLVPHYLLPSEQRLPGRGCRCIAGRRVRGCRAGVRQLGAGARFPRRKSRSMPAIKGRRLVFVQRPNSVQSSISVGNFSSRRDDARWYTLQLTNQIYGAAFDSRLVRNIREEKGYTYSPQSIFQAMAEGGFYRAAADVRNEVTGATLKEIYGEIDKLRAGGPAAEELADAKQYSRGLFLIQNATQAGFAGTLNTVNTFGLAKDYPETFQRQISQPSPEAIKTGAEMLLGSDDSVVVIVGDYTKVKDQLGAFTNITFLDLGGKPIPEPK